MKNDIKIMARTIEEFNKLLDEYNDLPFQVKPNIESVEAPIRFRKFRIRESFTSPIVIHVPNNIDNIVIKQNHIEIMCGNNIFEYPYKTGGSEVTINAWGNVKDAEE